MKKDNSQQVSLKMYDEMTGNISVFSAHLFLRRRSLHFIFNLIIPSFLITILSIMGFCLPPQSGEKIGLRKITFKKENIIL